MNRYRILLVVFLPFLTPSLGRSQEAPFLPFDSLSGAVLSSFSADTLRLMLPLPEGGNLPVLLWPSGVLPKALAARYPDIYSYAGRAQADPSQHIRLDYSPQGLSVWVRREKGDFLLEKKETDGKPRFVPIRQTTPLPPAHCGSEGMGSLEWRNGVEEPSSIGDSIYQYRLAVAASGEYTRFHGGTVERSLAAIVQTLNRVNAVLERDLAIRLVLVPDNDQLIFTDPATDPYTNNPRGQNQSVIDERIGGRNYDIGHLFTAGSLSRAEIASACVPGEKARALSALPEPVGLRFDIDYVAHEIGHQLGANHTFNQCGIQQGPRPVEPGSGSTIMGWPGLCDADDLQAGSDGYFHGASIREIVRYTRQGAGQTCASRIFSGNEPPRVWIKTTPTVIPFGTPFQLPGAGSDPEGEALRFSWEQLDTGPPAPVAEPNSESPIFRSWTPDPDSTRWLPRQLDLLRNSIAFGEQLPVGGRELNFQLTLRDQRGGVAWDSLQLQVSGEAGPFQVISQNLPQDWRAGAPVGIEWAVAASDLAPVNAKTVDILLSPNGGASFPILLAAATPNDGYEECRLPDTLQGKQFRLMVRASRGIFFDVNDADFTILPANPSSRKEEAWISGLSLSPNPAFGGYTQIRFSLQHPFSVRFRLLAADGRCLRTYSLGRLPAGEHHFDLDLKGLPHGIYLLFPDGAAAGIRLVR